MITHPSLGNSGRLGNQLWQIASTVGIARQLGEDFCFPEWDYQAYYNVPKEWFTGEPGTASYETSLVNHIDPRARVYLQDKNLWWDIQAEVKEWFSPSPLAREYIEERGINRRFERLTGYPVIVLHVRRGDNAYENEPGFHPVRPTSYYRDALKKFDTAGAQVAIFSDDPTWCEREFADLQPVVFHGTPRPKEHTPEFKTAPVLDWIDLQVMSEAGDYYIMSNSSYSWWGAFLSGVAGDHIIYPWPFMGKKLTFIDCSLMFPDDWTRLDHGHVPG